MCVFDTIIVEQKEQMINQNNFEELCLFCHTVKLIYIEMDM